MTTCTTGNTKQLEKRSNSERNREGLFVALTTMLQNLLSEDPSLAATAPDFLRWGLLEQTAVDDAFIDLECVKRLTGLKKTKIYGLIRDGRFPAPYKIGVSSRWCSLEIRDWRRSMKQSGVPARQTDARVSPLDCGD